ncbi:MULTISPECIES: hypothetical protein [unclassified Endozoicomonas]|uniref:hypothetical protein n=1 Tax=unclassified Endozoicomonas TaxID=2644528 RepID=UPI00214983EB|nr:MULTISPECIES: hypothetical protein [unclassified Endozoicomonas]
MIKHLLVMALPLQLLLLPVISQAKALTERFIIELLQNSFFPEQVFSIKPGLPALPISPPDIADTNSYAGPNSPPDEKTHRPGLYGIKTPLIESISWQLLYATHRLVGYELILNTKDASLLSNPYSWLPAEVGFAVGWLLKSYWNCYSPSFNPIAQQEATSMLTEGFATITMLAGSEHNQQPHSLSESSGEQASGGTTQVTGTFTSPLYFNSADGNRDPQQLPHTLDLNCFVHPCRGVCKFRSSSGSVEPAEWPLNSSEYLTGHTGAAPGQSSYSHRADEHCFRFIGHLDAKNARLSICPGAFYSADSVGPANDDLTMHGKLPTTSEDSIIIDGLLKLRAHNYPEETGISCTPEHCQQVLSTHWGREHIGQPACDASVVGRDNQLRSSGMVCKNAQALADQEGIHHTEQQTCDVTVVGNDGQQRSCGKICKNAQSLSSHKSQYHSGHRTCEVLVVGKDGQQRPCWRACENARSLSVHKRREHSGQQVCDVKVIGQDGQKRPCGTVCKNALNLSYHKSKYHGGQHICNLPLVGEDGQPRPCGKVFRNARARFDHKKRDHSGQQTCVEALLGEDGQLRPCGKVFRNDRALLDHKRKIHSGQRTCHITVVEDNELRLCRKVCKNARSLADHKKRHHTEQQICNVIVVGEDGQHRSCGTLCKNAQSLSSHKTRYHTVHKICEVIVVGEDGQQRPCGAVCKSVLALSDHRGRYHSEQQICNLPIVGEDGQSRPCGTVCKSRKALSDHKTNHRKRKRADVNQ